MKKNVFFKIENVIDKSSMGWLPVIDSLNNHFSLPYLTLLQETSETEKYIVMEGNEKNKTITIDYQKIQPRFFNKYLTENIKSNDCCKIFVSLAEQILFYKSIKGEMIQISIDVKDLSQGIYQIILPNKKFGERITNRYLNEENGGSRFAQTWFPIINNVFENRYIHFGNYSRGCVTVLDGQTDLWNNLYLYLMKSRMKDDVIGLLKVIEKIE